MRSRRRRRHGYACSRDRRYEQSERARRRIRQISDPARRDIRALSIRLRDDVDRRTKQSAEPVQHEPDRAALRNRGMGDGRRQAERSRQRAVVLQSFFVVVQTVFPQRFGRTDRVCRQALFLLPDTGVLLHINAF